MTIGELLNHLETLLDEDDFRRYMPVTFGIDVTPIEGGRIIEDTKGLAILNLAPIPLDQFGGF